MAIQFKADGIDISFDIEVTEPIPQLDIEVAQHVRLLDINVIVRTALPIGTPDISLKWSITEGGDSLIAFHIDPVWTTTGSCIALCLGKSVGPKILTCIWSCRNNPNRLSCVKDCLVDGLPGAVLSSAGCILECFG